MFGTMLAAFLHGSAMPTTTKNRDYRLQFIHKCLKNERVKWSKKRIHEEVQRHLESDFDETVSDRTVIDDLKYLRDQKLAPIEEYREGRNIFYRYSEPFELNEKVIDADQAFSLALAMDVLSQLKGFPVIEELKMVVEELSQRLELDEEQVDCFIQFDHQPLTRNLHLLQQLFECVREKTVIKISYKPFLVNSVLDKIIHPYLLKQFNGRWYLFGFDENNSRVDCSPLDRIEHFLPISREFQRIAFDPLTYFENIVGVTRFDNRPVENIVLKISPHRADYVLTKPLHHSQKEIERTASGAVIVEIKVIPNKELMALLLSFGNDLMIISPLHLQIEMKEALSQALDKYETESP